MTATATTTAEASVTSIQDLVNQMKLDNNETVQVILSDMTRTSAEDFELRALTLDDIQDDCPACLANRDAILAGNPPKAFVQLPASV